MPPDQTLYCRLNLLVLRNAPYIMKMFWLMSGIQLPKTHTATVWGLFECWHELNYYVHSHRQIVRKLYCIVLIMFKVTLRLCQTFKTNHSKWVIYYHTIWNRFTSILICIAWTFSGMVNVACHSNICHSSTAHLWMPGSHAKLLRVNNQVDRKRFVQNSVGIVNCLLVQWFIWPGWDG